MNHARLPRLLIPGLLALAVAAACSSTHDTGDYVPSQPGAMQPDAGGKLVAEDEACAALTKAEADARSALGCPSVKRDCPSYIRPAGGEGCFVYDQASIDGCSAIYRKFTACGDFDLHPCVIAAESQCTEPTMGEGGAAGAGGAAPTSAAGAAGVGGTPNSAGAGGALN